MSPSLAFRLREFIDAVDYRIKFEQLQYLTEDLVDARDTLEVSVYEAEMRGEDIQSYVEAWLRKASAVIEKATELIEDQKQKANRRCFVGLCPDLKTRYRLGRQAAKTSLEVFVLRNEGRFGQISYRAAVDGLHSRLSILSEVLDALNDPGISVVGLYGLGGVGKTTLAREVYRRAIKDTKFDVVVWATVSATPNLRAIQGQIADILGLELNEETVDARAAQLFLRLERAEMVLMILDDVWEPLDLKAVGIPFGGDHGMCKILLTSRNLDVSFSMGKSKAFRLDELPHEEALSLFKMKAGIDVENPTLRSIAAEIVRNLGGLPLALVIVAGALKGKGELEWKDAVSRTGPRSPAINSNPWDEKIKHSLAFSYDPLDEEIKSIFLLCGLQGKSNICIQDLLKYTLGLRLLKNRDTVDKVRERLHAIIGDLINKCFLHRGTSNGFVIMHDVLQDFAASNASRSLVIKSVVELKERQDKNCTRIVLPDCDISDLPEGLEFPELELLLLFSKYRSLKIPDSFFKGMEKLKVLNITRVISPLPSSLCFLTNLCALSLDKCMLDDVAMIGKLKKLEILSLSGPKIIVLPQELGELSQLKLLDLSNCFKLKVIPKNVISNFSLLEELYVGDSFVQWEVERLKNQSNANLTELELLSHLTTLEICVLDAEMLPKTSFFSKLKRYRVYIGDDWHWDGTCETSKTLKLNCNTSTYLKHWVTMLKVAEDLYLDEVEGIINILPDLNGEGFPELKHLNVQNCARLQYFIGEQCCALPRLKSLSLYNLLDLEKFCNRQLHSGSFKELRIIVVSNCSKLKHLFPLFLVRGLLQLQHMEVSDCVNMEEIVAEESKDDNEEIEVVEFAQLLSLKLHGLPQVRTFFSAEKMASILQTRPEHLPLFHSKVSFPNLEQLKLSSISCQNLWPCQLPRVLSTLKSLVVEGCRDLKYLLTSQLAENLLHLKELEVCDCESMETIVFTEEFVKERGANTLLFSNLHTLKLKNLSNVTSFFNGYLVECPSLKKLLIERCPVLKGFVWEGGRDFNFEKNFHLRTHPLFDEKVSFPNLEQLKLSSISCQNLWRHQLPEVFSTLKSLVVEGCRDLRYLLTSQLAKNLSHLKELEVCDCELMETIVVTEEFVEEEDANTLLFSKLHTLKLKNLSNVTSFSNGYPIGCPSLKKLLIERCPVLKGFVFSSPGVEEKFRERGREFNLEKNFSLRTHPLFDEKVVFPALEEMELSYIDCLQTIWESMHELSFYNLKTMKITQCKNLQTVFPDNDWDRFRSIENLWVSHCDSVKKIYELQGFDGEAAFALTELHVSDLSSLVHIWTEDTQGSVTFKNLFSVEISNCKSLKNIFPTSIARDLGQLEKLAISSCGVKEIVPGQHVACWPKLKCLKLSGCDKVIKFISCQEEAQQYVDSQQPFLVEEIVPNLEELLLEPQDFTVMQNCNFLLELISKLKVLELQSFRFQSEQPHSLFNHLKRLPSSAKLVVSKSLLRAIFSNEGPEVDGHLKTLPQIENLELHTLQEDVQLELDFQYLKNLRVSFCDTLEILAPLSASFSNLLSLEVWNCNGIKSLITSSIAKSMVHLRRMSIKDCRTVQDIIKGDEQHIEEDISFGKLEYLSLISLPGLTTFCSNNCCLRFPALEKLTVELCPKLLIFSQRDSIMPMLETVQLKEYSSEHIVFRDDNINAIIQQLYEREEQNKLPEIAKASEIPEMEEKWQGQPPFRRLRDVKILLVDKCTSFYAVSTSHMQSLNSLQVLVVENCDSIEEVFHLRGLNSDERHTGLISQLDELHLLNLPGLRNVWNANPQGILRFSNLTSIKVHNCGSLKNIFTLPMALDLEQLQYVEVKSCSSVEEIILKGEEEAVQVKNIFPSLCSIVLECLSSLKSLYSGSDVLQWPSLKKIDVIDCPRMETFASTFSSTFVAENKQMKCEGEFSGPVGPFSCSKVVLPSLQALRLDWNCITKEILDENFRADFLSRLKVIELIRLPKEYAQFPPNFFQRFPDLEKLVLSDTSFEHLSLYEGNLVEEEYLRSMAGLRKLKLSELPNLEHLVGEDRHLGTICQNLETLEVLECSRLETLVPSSVSFHNLTILEVVKCNGLVNLLTAATARSLALLTRMTVTDCQMIQEIVEGDDVEDDITFSRLRTLELCGLPSLTCFCSGNHIFNFPSLDEMVVTECPKMDVEALTR